MQSFFPFIFQQSLMAVLTLHLISPIGGIINEKRKRKRLAQREDLVMDSGRNSKRLKLPSNRWVTRRYKDDNGRRSKYYVLKDSATGRVKKRKIHPYGGHRHTDIYRRIADEEMRNRIDTTRYEGRKENVETARTESDEAIGGEVSIPIKGLPISIKGHVSEETLHTPKEYGTTFIGEGRKTFEQLKSLRRKKEESK